MNRINLLIFYSLVSFLFIGFSESSAQTWDELFRQKETQKEYLILQIGALEIHSRLLAESASIAKTGLDAVSKWKGWEKEIHGLFFDSFTKLGPMARAEYDLMLESGTTPEALLSRIESSRQYWENLWLGSEFFKATRRIHVGFWSRGMNGMEELKEILGNDLELEDADRAKRLSGLRNELELLHRDLMRVQGLLVHRVYIEKQQNKWQKEQNNY